MLLNLYRKCKHNIGDKVASVLNYFDLGSNVQEDVWQITPDRLNYDNILLGGGGLPVFDEAMKVLEPFAEKIICWGIGCNEFSTGYSKPVFQSWISRCKLVGVRDWGTPYEWVPCATCMSPLFDKTYEIKYAVGAYEHWEHKLKHEHEPKLKNSCESFEEVIEFLGSCETVVTNSYHGAYWATLLGRKAMVQPLNSKLYNFKHQPVIYSMGHWKGCIDKAKAFPEALAECRTANLKFYEKVKNTLDSQT